MKIQKVETTAKKLLRLHTDRNPELSFAQAYDEVIAYLRRTQHPPYGPHLPEDPRSSLTGITREHAAVAMQIGIEIMKYTDSDSLSVISQRDYITYIHWRL